MRKNLITIVSVSYNCENVVKKTLMSLVTQTYKDFEYIVIDGKSSDSTIEIIEEYRCLLKNMTVISEPDRGIYDAMNKGVSKANGEYIFFLNFGDCFYDKNVLENIIQKMESKADVYYGDIEKNGTIVVQKNKATLFNCIYREYMICHQAVFAKKKLLKRYPFDLTYRLCADRDWLIKVLRDGCKIEYCNNVICCYDTEGQSSDPSKFMEESKKVSFKYGGNKTKIFIAIKRFFGSILKSREKHSGDMSKDI